MCRSIHTLYNISPPTSQEEINAASLQFVRKISGFRKPSRVNEQAFKSAVEEISTISTRLLAALDTNAPVKDREVHIHVVR